MASVRWPETVTFKVDDQVKGVFDLIRRNNPMSVTNGVQAITVALQYYQEHQGEKSSENTDEAAALKEIRGRLEGASTAELKAILLEIVAELRSGGD